MTPQDIHLSEANRARDRLDILGTQLTRLHIVRVLLMTVAVLFVYAHFSRVLGVNAALREFKGYTQGDVAQTVVGYLANHRLERNYEMRSDARAQTLQRILAGVGAVSRQEVTVGSHGGKSVGEILRSARQRPDGIRVSIPYIGETELPLTHPVLALIAALLCIVSNLLLLLRQQEIADLREYASNQLTAVQIAAPDGGRETLKVEMRESPTLWPKDLVNKPLRAVTLTMLTGLSMDRMLRRHIDLVELGSGSAVVGLILALFSMFWYLILERGIWAMWPPLTWSIIGLLVLATIAISVGTVVGVGKKLLNPVRVPRATSG